MPSANSFVSALRAVPAQCVFVMDTIVGLSGESLDTLYEELTDMLVGEVRLVLRPSARGCGACEDVSLHVWWACI